MHLPLRYVGGDFKLLKLSKSKRLCYSEMCDLLLKTIEEDIWAWFYVKPECSVQEGLTIVLTNNDLNKMYDFAEIHGGLEVYVCLIPQAEIVEHYYKNLPFDDTDDEVTSLVRIHSKKHEDILKMSFEEEKVWEEAESNSPCILKTDVRVSWNIMMTFVILLLF